jgi:hypothetical protein
MPTRADESNERSTCRADDIAVDTVTVTITTCKRFDLFIKTMESFLRHCQDRERVAEWICVDDNSSEADRRQMAERFPFFHFILKGRQEKGHAKSMNLILDRVRTRFVLHLEDDWYFARDLRIGDLLALLADGRYQQVVLCPRPGSVPFGKTSAGFAVEECVYNPDHPTKPEIYRRYDEIYPAKRPGGEGGWWWPGFSLNPGIFDVAFLRSRVGRFDERIHRSLFGYDYALRAHEAAAKILTADCGLTHLGAVSAYGLNDQPRSAWDTVSLSASTEPARVVESGPDADAEETVTTSDACRIPNVVHFVYLDSERGFSFCNLLAVLSAHVVQKPKAIFLHYDRPPRASRWWEAARRYAMLVPRQPPAECGGMPLRSPQQQVEALRFQILLEQGGISLDTGVLTLKPYNPLRTHTCVLGGGSYVNGQEGLCSDDLDQIDTITDAVLMAAPRHLFFARCIEEIPRRFQGEGVAADGVGDLHDLARRHRDLVHIEPVESFVPFDCGTDELFRDVDRNTLDDLFARKLSRSYCIHLWPEMWGERFLNEIDEAYLLNRKNLMAAFFRGYLFYLESGHA